MRSRMERPPMTPRYLTFTSQPHLILPPATSPFRAVRSATLHHQLYRLYRHLYASAAGMTTIDVAANKFTNSDGSTAAATQFNWTYDNVAPLISSVSLAATQRDDRRYDE